MWRLGAPCRIVKGGAVSLTALIFVANAVIPALLIMVAVRALSSWRKHPGESAAWIVMSIALGLGLGYPALLDVWRAHTGMIIPLPVVGLIGVGAGSMAVFSLLERVTGLEKELAERETATPKLKQE